MHSPACIRLLCILCTCKIISTKKGNNFTLSPTNILDTTNFISCLSFHLFLLRYILYPLTPCLPLRLNTCAPHKRVWFFLAALLIPAFAHSLFLVQVHRQLSKRPTGSPEFLKFLNPFRYLILFLTLRSQCWL